MTANEDQVIIQDGRTTVLSTYDSLEEFAAAAIGRRGKINGYSAPLARDVRKTADELNSGVWEQYLTETLEVAEAAVSFIEAEHMVDTFSPVFDVAGGNVDVSRFLAGEPECMVDYPLAQTSKLGRVVAMIASTDAMANVGYAAIQQRGQVLTALAIALERLGHATEFWVDMGASFGRGSYHSRICVKGPNDVIDPAKLLFAYCNGNMLGHLQFACENGNKISNPRTNGHTEAESGGRGNSENVFRYGLPDDMIAIDSALFSSGDVRGALMGLLKHLGLIEDIPEMAQTRTERAAAAYIYCDCSGRHTDKHRSWCSVVLGGF